MNRIEMIKALGDPRIGVVVTYYIDADNAAKEKYPLMCEAAINRKLVELGFSHVFDSALIYNEKILTEVWLWTLLLYCLIRRWITLL